MAYIYVYNHQKHTMHLYQNKYILATGAGAVDYIIDHAEIDVVFIQDKKIKEVPSNKLIMLHNLRVFCLNLLAF
jgi:hypothetical protein